MLDSVSQFKDAILSAGLIPPPVIEPGKFQRFPGEGKGQRNESGWCKLFDRWKAALETERSSIGGSKEYRFESVT